MGRDYRARVPIAGNEVMPTHAAPLSFGLSEYGLDVDTEAYWARLLAVPDREDWHTLHSVGGGNPRPHTGGRAAGVASHERAIARREKESQRYRPTRVGLGNKQLETNAHLDGYPSNDPNRFFRARDLDELLDMIEEAEHGE